MNEKALRILEYTKIIDMLSEQAASDMGKELCRKLTPMTDIEAIRKAQRETSDALFRIVKKGGVSFSGLKDVGMSLKRLEIGASLGMSELLALSSMLSTANRVKHTADARLMMTPVTALIQCSRQSNRSHHSTAKLTAV